MEKVKVSILGATGYAGVELFRFLYRHPFVNITSLSSVSFEGQNISHIYKNLINIQQYTLENQDIAIEKSDIVFSALPHGLSEPIADKCDKSKKILIDLGADFRLTDEDEYKKWYELPFKNKDLHLKAVYGLPELNRDKIKVSKIIGNPGCYPTTISLGLYPLLKDKLINTKGIVCDCKSGVTGAGRALSQTTHFPDCNEAFSPYKVANHRHIPEIEETLCTMAKEPVTITFVPHLLPINRGILSTIYTERTNNLPLNKIHELYKEFYKNEPFVRVMDLGDIANIKNVTYSNYCDISLHEDIHTNKIIVVSTIDNMIKGASGQAIQNMNIRMNFDETTGIDFLPSAF